MAETEETVQREREETLWWRWAHQDLQETKVIQGFKELSVLVDRLVRKVHVETLVCVGLRENGGHRARPQEESPILAGVGQSAPLTKAPSLSTLEELEHLKNPTREEQLTICACLMTLTIFSILAV